MKIKKWHIGAFILFCIPPMIFSMFGYFNPHQTLLWGLGLGLTISTLFSLVVIAVSLITSEDMD